MPPRPYYRSVSSYSFGPGPISSALKILIAANVVLFFMQRLVPATTLELGLRPVMVVEHFKIWQLVTYMFLHVGLLHILFNMLALWMFGAELERIWGTRYFLKFYFVTGGGAAILTVIFSYVFSLELQGAVIIGASGAIYGLLLAYAVYYPNRQIYMYFLFPVPVKYFVMIVGAISLLSATGGPGSGVAHATHLGGLAVGYLYLKGRRLRLGAELQYRLNRWRIDRMRRRFDVHKGGKERGPWIH